MRKFPMVWLTIAYAGGIVLGRCFSLSGEFVLVFAAGVGALYFCKRDYAKNAVFYLLLLCLSCAIYPSREHPGCKSQASLGTAVIGNGYRLPGDESASGQSISIPGKAVPALLGWSGVQSRSNDVPQGRRQRNHELRSCQPVGLHHFSRGMPLFGFEPQLLTIRQAVRRAAFYNFPPGTERDLMAGLFLGERARISAALIDVFRNTNTIHILAISGLHVGCIGLILIFSLRLLRVPRRTASVFAVLGVIVYVFIVGWRPPAFRAAVMFTVLLSGWIINRQTNTVNSLFFAAFIILLISPDALFSPGFQLSFVVVFSLLLLVPVVAGGQKTSLVRYRFRQAAAGCFVAWLGSLPLVAYYFQVVSPLAVVANLFVVPLVTLIIASGFAGIMLGQLYLPVSGIFNAVTFYLLKKLVWLVTVIARIPGCYFQIKEITLSMVFLYYIIFGVIIFLPEARRMLAEWKLRG